MSSEEIVYCQLAYIDAMDRQFKDKIFDLCLRAAICSMLILIMSGVTIFMRHGTVFAAELHDGMVEVAPPAATASEDSIPAVPAPASDPLNSYYDDVMDEAKDSSGGDNGGSKLPM